MSSTPPPPQQPQQQGAGDMDMSTSSTLPPAGQRHDRDDADMQDGLTNGLQPDASSTPAHNQADSVAIEVAAVSADEDAMDTTSDDAQDLIQPNASAEPAAITPASPPPAEVSGNDDAAEHVTSTAVSNPTSFLISLQQVYRTVRKQHHPQEFHMAGSNWNILQ
jgi:hypothetical protein